MLRESCTGQRRGFKLVEERARSEYLGLSVKETKFTREGTDLPGGRWILGVHSRERGQ